jgi:hypothetical protein
MMAEVCLMRLRHLASIFPLLLVLSAACVAAPFVLFPKAGQLSSPDGRFVLQNLESDRGGGEFVGTFHSLWLTEKTTGRSRKLCDYVGVAAVAWSGNDFLVVTEYVSKKTSRALVFPVAHPEEPIVLDAPTVARSIPWERRAALVENDRVFVEASHLEDDTLHLRVWGYGRHDTQGFRWNCQYKLWNGSLSCEQ